MSKQGSCCDVRKASGSWPIRKDLLCVWDHVFCLTCGGGKITISEGGSVISCTTTGNPCVNLDGLGREQFGNQPLTELLPPTPSATPERPGSCKGGSTSGKPPATSE